MKRVSSKINFDPRALEISDHVPEGQLNYHRPKIEKNGHPPVIVLADKDALLYVADGNTRALIDREMGKPVSGVIVEDDYQLGPQNALDRVLGIFFLRKER
ncbi:hypothetical protein HY411_02230 [Candidatus Gottesmanbacteria bacterium]|nr:hypothetical protein [Candidatus Gottesmanbacteria bacterium]